MTADATDVLGTGAPAAEDAYAEARLTPAGLGFWEAAALVLLWMAIMAIPAALSLLVAGATGHGVPAVFQILAAQVLVGVVTIPLALRWSGLPLREACPTPPIDPGLLPGLLLGSIGLAIVLGEVANWMPGVERGVDEMGRLMGSSGLLPAILAGWLAAPVLEELLLRGAMLRGLRVGRSAWRAITITAVLWAVLHFNAWQGITAIPLGLAYGWLSLRTRSVLPTIFCHAVTNATHSLVLLPALLALGYTPRELRHALHYPPIILVPAAILALAGCALVWWRLRGGSLDGDGASAAAPVAARPSQSMRLVAAVLVGLAVIVASLLASTWAQSTPGGISVLTDESRDRLAGCYRTELPPEVGARLFGGSAPAVLRLSTRPYRASPAVRNTYVVELFDATPAAPLYWVPGPQGRLAVAGGAGGSVTLTLHGGYGTLTGDALMDDDTTGTRRSVRARWIPCPVAGRGRP